MPQKLSIRSTARSREGRSQGRQKNAGKTGKPKDGQPKDGEPKDGEEKPKDGRTERRRHKRRMPIRRTVKSAKTAIPKARMDRREGRRKTKDGLEKPRM